MYKQIFTDRKYLSDVFLELPSKVLLNKGVTGCGGTYVELNSKRNSIILVPTIELAKNKEEENFLVVYSKVTNPKIKKYVESDLPYKKIIATYDSLNRLMQFKELKHYFLLVDEYHVLFNAYAFRNKAIFFLLENYTWFDDFCFMTATPLKEDVVLDQIKHLPRINVIWEKAIPIKLKLLDVSFTNKELLKEITKSNDVNYHIFLNSVTSIKDLVSKLRTDNYRVVCSQKANKTLKISSTKDPVKKYNFYTSAAFEGCDIYDPIGKTIILCDTRIASTILDILTLIQQIAGRLRNSIYKEEITIILNTGRHRYAGVSDDRFIEDVKRNIRIGKLNEHLFKTGSSDYRLGELKKFNKESFQSIYLNKFENEIFYDDNLRKMDEFNYDLVKKIYDSSVSVLKEFEKTGAVLEHYEVSSKAVNSWITEQLENRSYTYQELETIFTPLFAEKGFVFSSKSLKDFFPEFTKKRKIKNKIRNTYYKFELNG